jgi:uncharacterized membrane protein YphA (DoxX/SURF4 family)
MKDELKINWFNIISIILGGVYLLSGLGKLRGVDAFESLIESYGFPYFSFLAPAIILFELLLGILLILCYRQKLLGLISCIILLVFTACYTYAYVVHGVTDCGCFGSNPILQQSPALSYTRNAIMIVMSVILILYGENKHCHLSRFTICVISFVMVISAFITGLSFRVPSMFVKPHPLFMKPVSETRIPDYVDISNDSTYVVYVFSYNCSSCWNNMANFMNYKNDSIADVMLGLCVGGNGKNTFMDYFKPEFDIYEVDANFSENINVIPTFLYIKDGLIHDLIQGGVLNSKLFKDNYLNNN